MKSLRVLITNYILDTRTGTELYVQELATELLKRGHTPIVYSTHLGKLAQEIRQRSIPVTDDLTSVTSPPDIIHGQHNMETMTALLRFSDVPAVYFSHDNLAWCDIPPHFPRILRYVAVDYTCRDRLTSEYGIEQKKTEVLHNSVDLDRFLPREPLPARPRRALAFGNAPGRHTNAIRKACQRTRIELDFVGSHVERISGQPEYLLGNYDIVFARGRSALESLAVGAAVILCGQSGLGPMVTSAELDRLRSLNFGHRALQNPFDADELVREIGRYDPNDAAAVSQRIRAITGRDAMIDSILEIYDSVLEEYSQIGPRDAESEARAVAEFLRWITLHFKQQQEILDRSSTVRVRKGLLRVPVLGPLALSLTGLALRKPNTSPR